MTVLNIQNYRKGLLDLKRFHVFSMLHMFYLTFETLSKLYSIKKSASGICLCHVRWNWPPN